MSPTQPQHDHSVALLFAGLIVCALSALPSCASRRSEVQEPASEAESKSDSGAAGKKESESERDRARESAPESDSGSEPETETETESESNAAIEAEIEADVESKVESEIAAETEPEAAADITEPKKIDSWKPPEPGEGKFDWIRLESGEWLKGDITYMRNRTMEFDSDKLNELVLDWKDVVEIRSPRMNTVLLEGQIQHTGTLLIRDDVVVLGGDEPRTFPRDQLVSIVPGEEREADYWSGKISVGTTFRSGNTDQTDVTARATIYRRTALTRTTFDYTGSVTTIGGREEVNNHRGRAGYNVYLTQDFYLIPFAIEYYKDRISNIRHRITPGSGGGYWILDTPTVEWNVDLLGGYRYTEFDDVAAGDDKTEQTAAVIAQSKFDWEVTNDIDLILEYRIDVGLSNLTDTNHHAISTLSIDVATVPDLSLDVSFIWDRVGNPRRDADGDFPEKDDFRLVVGLGVDF